MYSVLRTILAAGEVTALPVRTTWPVHKAVLWLSSETDRLRIDLGLAVRTTPDPDVCMAAEGVEDALAALVADGFLRQSGVGYLATWVTDPDSLTLARRELFRADARVATLLAQAGQRLATWASTAVKNSDTAAESWGSTVRCSTPTDRHPVLVGRR
jgi:hypothetical protein